ncbi:MAG: M48 family metallopeptidase [bacterium]|nr:M48 family metallopeptidase [bacterium]
MRKHVWIYLGVVVGLGVGGITGCYTVPVTGRTSMILVPQSEEFALGMQAYNDVRSNTPLSRDTALISRVQRIGSRLAAASDAPTWAWEFAVFEEQTPNAWCLPGGKVGVYSGLMRYVYTDGELATVLAHEIGHAVARHGAERMSQQMIVAAGGAIVAGSVSDKNVEVAKVAYGIGSELFVMLPYSRKQEYEADEIGLIYMARAGYDPREAVTFWERFRQLSQGRNMPEWFSTHPADEKRVARLRELMPRALAEYQRVTGKP